MLAYLYPSAELGLAVSVFELTRPITTLGRHPNNDISLLLDSVSRFHCNIEQRGNIWLLNDLNSSNGTFLNGERIASPRSLSETDVLTLGRADFTFSLQSPSERLGKPPVPGQSRRNEIITSSVNIVEEDESSSVILSTQLNVESTPLPGSGVVALGEDLDIADLVRANERLMTLYKLAEVIRSGATVEEMLDNVMNLVFEMLPADRGAIMTLDPLDHSLEPRVVRHRRPEKTDEFTISKTIVNKCLTDRIAILSRDAKIDRRFSGSESIVAGDMRSAMCVPLVSKKHMIGILFVDTRESIHAFTEDDLQFLSSIGSDVAFTVENLTLAQENIKNERLAAVGQTIAGLAHNIKNILQLARGGIELMDGAIERKTMDEVAVYWPVVRRGIDRMQSLTQEMLAYSRQTQPDLVEANVNDVITETVETFQQDRVEAGVEITVDLSPDVPPRRIDADGLNKSLMNLVGNAVDAFEGGGGAINISTAHDEGTITIRVKDNGKGIPKEKLAKIFQPFFTTKGSKGTGLGLSMTRKYIEDMGGTLGVESEEGHGTTFLITLPPFTVKMAMDLGDAENPT